MAPGYRTNTQTRRGARAGYPEHDDFEGLPVRQWRKQWVSIAPPPETEENKKTDRWAEELPHGMPKDSDLLPPHSLALLRAARSGCLRKRPSPADDEDGDADALPGDKTEKKASAMDEGFRILMWKQVPRSEEGPTISHLAKRQKGTITLPSKALATQTAGPTITKATVRRIDAAGNPYTQEVTVTDGQQVDGEVISTSVVPAPELTGQAPPAAATPTRRKPAATQKKKGRGRGRGGRGRGRGLPLQASTRSAPQDGSGMDGAAEVKNEAVGPDGVKMESEDSRAGQDVDMRDSSAMDEDGDEGEGEGEGDDGDDDDGDESGTPVENEDQEMDDAPPLADAAPSSTAAADISGPSLNLAPPTPNPLNTDTSRIEGSPLKNVLIRSPTDVSSQIPPMEIPSNTEVGTSELPEEPTLGIQPSPGISQSQQAPASEVIEEIPAGQAKPLEAATSEKPDQEMATSEPDVQEPIVPEAVIPDAVVPEPAVSETVNPEPVNSEPFNPEPVNPEPVDPEPVHPEPVIPEPVIPEPVLPEPVLPEPAVLEASDSEPTVLEATVSDATAPETTVSETTAPDMTAPETTVQETTAPDTIAPEPTAPESSEQIAEEMTGVVAISAEQSEPPVVPIPDPPAVSPAAVERPPPVEDASQAELPRADIPIPTSEDPKTGEAPEVESEAVDGDTAVMQPEAPPTEPISTGPTPAEPAAPGPAPDPVPVEPTPITQEVTEEGTDDGSDLLGPLGASLSRQAEEDVPAPTSAPANPEIE